MRAVLADTGPLYAAVDPDDQYHQRSQTELERIRKEKLAIIVNTGQLIQEILNYELPLEAFTQMFELPICLSNMSQ